jgi:hypothetical protein
MTRKCLVHTRKRDDGVDVDWMDGLAVGGDDGHRVAFDGDLCWTNGREGSDHAESVAFAWRHGEDFERRVGHESGVGIAELALAVDQQRFGILASVDGQTTRISLGGILMQPIAQHNDVRGQIEVVEM